MTEEEEARPTGWLKMTLLGWLVHVALGAGLYARATAAGTYWVPIVKEWHLSLPHLQTWIVHPFAAGMSGPNGPWVMAGLGVFDLAMLLGLAVYARAWWKWWFWGVAVLLILATPAVEFAYVPLERRLRAAGLPLP